MRCELFHGAVADFVSVGPHDHVFVCECGPVCLFPVLCASCPACDWPSCFVDCVSGAFSFDYCEWLVGVCWGEFEWQVWGFDSCRFTPWACSLSLFSENSEGVAGSCFVVPAFDVRLIFSQCQGRLNLYFVSSAPAAIMMSLKLRHWRQFRTFFCVWTANLSVPPQFGHGPTSSCPMRLRFSSFAWLIQNWTSRSAGIAIGSCCELCDCSSESFDVSPIRAFEFFDSNFVDCLDVDSGVGSEPFWADGFQLRAEVFEFLFDFPLCGVLPHSISPEFLFLFSAI